MQRCPELRGNIIDLASEMIIRGNYVIFITHDGNSADQWCHYFADVIRSIGLNKKCSVTFERRSIRYNFPSTPRAPDMWAYPFTWAVYWLKRLAGLIQTSHKQVSIRFIPQTAPVECLYGYHGLVFYDKEMVREKDNLFWATLRAMQVIYE